MGRMEIITRVERRRRFSAADRAAVLAQCDEPGATVAGVAERLDISRGLIHLWRRKRREADAIASAPLQFIPFDIGSGACLQADATTVAPVNRDVAMPDRLESGRLREPTAVEELLRPHAGPRPGSIEVDLGTGVRLSVDSYVNEKALVRVLRALKAVA